MKLLRHNLFIFIVCLSLVLIPSAFAATQDTITGFEPLGYLETIDTEFKLSLPELNKSFPTSLNVFTDGSDNLPKTIDIAWKCLENYDDELEEFHFVPDIADYKLAEGLELPVITVHILGKFEFPNMPFIPEEKPSRPFPAEEKSIEAKASLPSSYNGYKLGKLPKVRDQGSEGACWAFATIACVEADLIHDGKANTGIDLSELHLAYYTYHNFYDEKGLNSGDTVSLNGTDWLDGGGNAHIATQALMNMLGPVYESTAPYSRGRSYNPGSKNGRTGKIQVVGTYQYDIVNDRASVKQAIMDHGAVAVAFYANYSRYSSTYNSFYTPTSPGGTNHVVAVVGWDDNFSRYNFSSGTPSGNGAWLIRNSWGYNGEAYQGYFWMSYYDQSLYSGAFAVDTQTWRYDHVYAYDNVPGFSLVSDGDISSGAYVSQKFRVNGGEQIKAIGLYMYDYDWGINIYVKSGSTRAGQYFSAARPGYYMIPLSNPITITNTSDVTVEYNFIKGYWKDSFVSENQLNMSNGITFYPHQGSSGVNVNGYNYSCDQKLKLFTNNVSTGTWKNVNGKWYYYENGKAVTGWKYISSKWYYFNSSGVMQTGWIKISNKWYYLNSSGAMQTGWAKIGSKYYYFNSSGVMQTSWKKINNKWYYFNSGGAMQTGWLKISNKWYYLNSSGAMQTGWAKIGSKYYYFSSSGVMVTGWQKKGNNWFYFETDTTDTTIKGAMHTGWLKYSRKWYYFDTNGYMKTGWKKLGNHWFYFETDTTDTTIKGAMHIGWLRYQNNWYYLDANGYMATGRKYIGGRWYSFRSDGVLIS